MAAAEEGSNNATKGDMHQAEEDVHITFKMENVADYTSFQVLFRFHCPKEIEHQQPWRMASLILTADNLSKSAKPQPDQFTLMDS